MTVIVGDISTLLTSMTRSSKPKINKETLALTGILDLVDINEVFHPKIAETHSFQVYMAHFPG